MPYPNFGRLAPEDVRAILAYVRTLPPIESLVPERRLDFPLGLLVRTMPAPARPGQRPPASDPVRTGEYLVRAASCAECHTMQRKGTPVSGMEFAGGYEFRLPFGIVRSANITPDEETGIGEMSKEQFASKFRALDPAKSPPAAVKPEAPNTVMPWTLYAGMTDEDLAALYDYLRTLKPVRNEVERFTVRGAER
jgi:mono/diheme cytochrome c family protein